MASFTPADHSKSKSVSLVAVSNVAVPCMFVQRSLTWGAGVVGYVPEKVPCATDSYGNPHHQQFLTQEQKLDPLQHLEWGWAIKSRRKPLMLERFYSHNVPPQEESRCVIFGVALGVRCTCCAIANSGAALGVPCTTWAFIF